MENTKLKNKKIAFVVGAFPVVSETFVINQVADLLDRGCDVKVFSFLPGKENFVSDRFFNYHLRDRVTYLSFPRSKFLKAFLALSKVIKIFLARPTLLLRIFNVQHYGQFSWSLKTLFWVEPFINQKFDLVHCHFGTVANKFLLVKEILDLQAPLVVSFYGYDISHVVKEKGLSYYDRLKKEAQAFIVMSNNMRERLMGQGFAENKISVLPVSIDVPSYPFRERKFTNYPVNLFSVGRFVEKKGFSDLFRAIRLVVNKTGRDKIKLHIVGDGPLKEELFFLAKELELESNLKFYGYQKVEDVIKLFMSMDIYLQTSKTARDGDME